MHIHEVVPGDRVRLVDFGNLSQDYKRRLLFLGFTRGVEFSIVRMAPLGCPIQIEIRGTSLTLRKDEAASLILERV